MTALPGAASVLLRGLLSSPVGGAEVVGVHPTCVYVLAGAREVVAVETADAAGLPGAVRLGVASTSGVFARVRRGSAVTLGAGGLVAGPLDVAVARWWAPRRPSARLVTVAEDVGAALAAALADRPAPVAADGRPSELVGLGPGLTPAGDDVLAGLLVGLHHRPDLRDPLAAEVLPLAERRTSALSATLLRQAVAGHGVPALLDLADVLAVGDLVRLPTAVDRLVAVGHSSGTALAWGLLRAARALSTAPPSRPV